MSDEALAELMGMLHRAGVLNVKWYLITGFPGEDESDLGALRRVLDNVLAVYPGHLSLTVTLLQPVPHTPLGWADGHYDQEAAARAMSLRTHLRGVSARTGRVVSASQPKGPGLHEHDVLLSRGDRRVADYIVALDSRESLVSSGAWRDLAAATCDAAAALRPMDPTAATPWSGVDVGTPASTLRLALATYQRRMVRNTPTVSPATDLRLAR